MTENLTKLTVNLAPTAFDALVHGAAVTGDTNTDTVGRALIVYDHIVTAIKHGGGRLTISDVMGGLDARIFVTVSDHLRQEAS